MGNPVEQDGIRKHNLRAIDPRTPILEHGKHQIRSLETLDRDVTQARRENDIVGDDVVLEHLLERRLVDGLDDGADCFKGGVSRHEDCEVGNVEADGVRAREAKVDGELGGFERAVHGEVAGTVGEELKGGAKGEDGVDLVDGNAGAEFDVLMRRVSKRKKKNTHKL